MELVVAKMNTYSYKLLHELYGIIMNNADAFSVIILNSSRVDSAIGVSMPMNGWRSAR